MNRPVLQSRSRARNGGVKLGLTAPGDEHTRAFFEEERCGGETDTAAAACDECNLPEQFVTGHVISPRLWAVIDLMVQNVADSLPIGQGVLKIATWLGRAHSTDSTF